MPATLDVTLGSLQKKRKKKKNKKATPLKREMHRNAEVPSKPGARRKIRYKIT